MISTGPSALRYEKTFHNYLSAVPPPLFTWNTRGWPRLVFLHFHVFNVFLILWQLGIPRVVRKNRINSSSSKCAQNIHRWSPPSKIFCREGQQGGRSNSLGLKRFKDTWNMSLLTLLQRDLPVEILIPRVLVRQAKVVENLLFSFFIEVETAPEHPWHIVQEARIDLGSKRHVHSGPPPCTECVAE